jgi:hypothetical protein
MAVSWDNVRAAMVSPGKFSAILICLATAGALAARDVPPIAAWTSVGPQPIESIPAGTAIAAPFSGRIDPIAVDPKQPTMAFAGAAGGGLWRTLNDGVTWTPLTDRLPSLKMRAVAIDPLNSKRIVAGANAAGIDGSGLYFSRDSGNSWTMPGGSTFAHSDVMSIGIGPIGNVWLVIARTPAGEGIWRSEDDGASWSMRQSLSSISHAHPYIIQMQPADPYIWWAAVPGLPSGALYRSEDTGLTWTMVTSLTSPGLPADLGPNPVLAFSTSNPKVCYLTAGTSPMRVYKSGNDGATWAPKTAPEANLNVLVVHPERPDVLFAGWDRAWQSTDSGETWTHVSFGMPEGASAIHPDINGYAIDARGRIWLGTDGGVYRTSDVGSTYQNLNQSLSVSQLYSIDAIGSRICAGTQDNGMPVYVTGRTWTVPDAGDFGACIEDPLDASTIYFSSLGGPGKSTDGGRTLDTFASGIDLTDPHILLPPMFRTSAGELFLGTDRVYLSKNAMLSWAPVSPHFGTGSREAIMALGGQDQTIYALLDDGRIESTVNFGGDWSETASLGLTLRLGGQIAVNPSAPNNAIIATGTSGSIGLLVTHDSGATWTPIGAALGDDLAESVEVDWSVSPNVIFVGTNVGVLWSRFPDAGWNESVGLGLPRAEVRWLKIDQTAGMLYAATYGRGVWRARIIAR